MAQAGNQELTDRFIQFYRNYYREEIGTLAQKYPNEKRSLYVEYDDLYQFDRDLAEDYLSQPDQIQEYAQEALRLYDLPADVKLGNAHVRIRNLPESVDIRSIRVHDNHIGKLVSVRGIVRKATDVRPKITDSAFECQRCGTMNYIPQADGDFQEPHDCQGCEREGPFKINFDQSEFVDAQKLRIQESPEGLRGGETPQSIDVNIEDDITGKVTAGDHVTVVGILHIEQMDGDDGKSSLFDLYMDGISITIEDEVFEDMDITQEDKTEIIELSNDSDIYEKMVASVAPSIFGYDEEKLAMILQLFSGVTKNLPDGSRIRGDLHMLLIGDPGTGKCVSGNTRVTLADGSEREIRDLVEENLDDPNPVDDGVWDHVDVTVPSLQQDGTLGTSQATKVWKRESPEQMYRITTETGISVTVTPSHPLFVQTGRRFAAVRADELSTGDPVGVSAGGQTVSTASEPPLATDGGNVVTEQIETIEVVDPDDEWVYDLEVEGTHNYLTNNVISHNSQMLSYIENIAPRSVYTSGKGSSSAGLCVTGDTKIHTAEGFVPIRDIATEYHPDPVDEETAVEAAYDLYTYDRDAGEIESTESSHVWRMPEKPCRRIETAHGKTLETSLSTPVLVCRDNGTEWCEMSAVEAGDHVAVPKYTDINRHSPPVREFFEFTEEKIKPTDESVEFLRTRLCEEFGTLRDAAAALDLPEDFIYDSLSHRHLPLGRLRRILDSVGAELRDIDVDRVMLRHGDGITIPSAFDADLMYLIGLVFGDGDVMVSRRGGNRGHVRISNADTELLECAADIIEVKFGKRVDIEYQDERVPCIRLHSATVARFFSNVGVESPKDDIALDPRLTTAEHADAFLQGLFDADGSVCGRDDGGSSIQFSTICGKLAEQVQLILESYGIRARSRKRDRRGTYTRADGYEIESTSIQTHLALYGREIDVFAEQIGFRSTTKAAELQKIVQDAQRRGERLPLANALARTDGGTKQYWMNCNRGDNPSRERARAMVDDIDRGAVESIVKNVAEADLVWDEVVDVKQTGEKELFDLTVPDTHNFLANGIVTHNTAAAVRDDFGDGQQWTLEAGALVLADQGIAAVDELDKMRCVTGETLVHCGDGRIKRIGELATEAAQTGEIEPLSNGRTIRDTEFDVWTMTEDGSLVRRPVTAVHEYEAPDALRSVTLESGEQLTATDDHPFFVREDGERLERPASDLEDGDWIYVPRAIPSPASDGGVVTESTTAVESTAETTPTEDTLSPALGAILGYLSGDGNIYYNRSEGSYGIRFVNAEQELLSHFEAVCRGAFDAEPSRPPSEQRDDGVETVRLHGKAYANTVLDAGMNLENYDGKSFPTVVSTGCRRTKAAFIRALADSEGTVDTATGNAKIYSASYELLIGSKELLLEFGVSTQIQTRERSGKRDLYVLAITDAESLAAYARHIGFTLERKREALDTVVESASGDRTILNVIPSAGLSLQETRDSLRLYQRECGINGATYCEFEQGTANISLHRARRVLDAFEARKREAKRDAERLTRKTDTESPWETLAEIRERYHISYAELAEGTDYSQQQLSAGWDTADALRTTVRSRLAAIVSAVASTDLSEFRTLVEGDVKWRRVDSVESVPTEAVDDTVPPLREKLADLLGGGAETVITRAQDHLDTEPQTDSWESLRNELDRYGISFAELATEIDVAPSTVSRWFSGVVATDRFPEVQTVADDRIAAIRTEIRRLLDAIAAAKTPKVYDLTVEGTHNFVANGMVVHNSEDRSAMHQALEQQEISISKAGINATLKSRCSLLGAANPKYGRFDQYEPIGEQIDLEPALVSRFDLIFTVTDKPDPEHDGKLADHILKTNYAGELNTQRANVPTSEFTQQQVDDVTEQVAPEIEAELLRKYVAHAKRSCFPTMTDEAKAAIREFYVDLRSKGADEDAPIPVTARKLEALVRLAEASARVRLSDTVEVEDATRSVDIVRSCLKDIGVDPETGQFDADVVETGTSKTQRDRIKNVKELIAEIEDEFEEGAPLEEVLDRADEIGMDASKAEKEIEKLRRKGDVYEPRQGHLRTT